MKSVRIALVALALVDGVVVVIVRRAGD